jgi:hypothetical protein
MSPSGRTRPSAFAAAFSGALVLVMAGTALAANALDCSDVDYQEEAQAVLKADPSDPHRLGGGTDGVACDSLPSSDSDDSQESDEDADAPATTPAAAPEVGDGADGDRDCPDFAPQAQAQAALAASPGDREQPDADDDGTACEQHFGTEGQQVAVFPQGAVATGASARAW